MSKRALVIVDIQPDFLPGGALAVEGGNDVMAAIMTGDGILDGPFEIVVATGDQHPPHTPHFGTWPVHCVEGTRGAKILFSALTDYEIHKGAGSSDGYSAFEGRAYWSGVAQVERSVGVTLLDLLREVDVEEVVVCGLALDHCVKATALDAARYGYDVKVPLHATAPVSQQAGQAAVRELREAGVWVG